eukprot:SAG31_NODE_1650_length_7635_cov_12.658705_2_plen_72_part_00
MHCSGQIEKARQQVQQTSEAYNQAQMQHRKEYNLYQEWTARGQGYSKELKAAQQVRLAPSAIEQDSNRLSI